MLNFKTLLPVGLQLVNELSKTDLPGQEKLTRVTVLVAEFFEQADNVVELLPWGISWIAKLVVDNPVVDGLQYKHWAVPTAEMLYQIWKGITTSGGSIETFVQNIGGEA
jgi:hypothetical protein